MPAIVRAWRIMPRLGVVPPSMRSPQSSTRCAPAAFAARTPATASTHISKIMGPSSPEQWIDIEQPVMLLHGVTVGHAGNEIAHFARPAVFVLKLRPLPVRRQQARILAIGRVEVAHDAPCTQHDRLHLRMPVHVLRE